ncbi:hypothetical protein ACFSC3_04245 [Sphingomonas floccifaciens]|uniref:Uncharacterized protein n=1 Tax=Sphingomonas floccifaciens TaxID=1844115 RepID=A0ABW4N9C9_9SPHN
MKTLLLATTLLAMGSAPAMAQTTPAQTLPGADRFELPPGNSQATPTPSPTPTATPSASTPPPVVRTVPVPTPTAAATLQPRPTPVPAATPTPRPTATAAPVVAPTTAVPPTPTATPAPTLAPVPGITSTPLPTPTPTETATPVSASTPTAGPPVWLLWLFGLGGAGVVAYAVLAWRRRSAAAVDVIYGSAPPPAPEGVPHPEPQPQPQAPAVSATAPSDATPAAADALTLDFHPQRLWTRGPDAHLAFDLMLTNAGTAPLSGVRPVVTLASAGPETERELTDFTAQIASLPGGKPFDLGAGETRKIAGELVLPGDAMHVTTAADREMIVPIAMVGATWRSGLSVASATEAFVVGPGDPSSPKLGPVWVDRPGQTFARLDARRLSQR